MNGVLKVLLDIFRQPAVIRRPDIPDRSERAAQTPH